MRPRINNSHPPPRTYELLSSDMMVVMMMMMMMLMMLCMMGRVPGGLGIPVWFWQFARRCTFSLGGDDHLFGPSALERRISLGKTCNRRRSAVFLKREARPWRGAFRLEICRNAGMTTLSNNLWFVWVFTNVLFSLSENDSIVGRRWCEFVKMYFTWKFVAILEWISVDVCFP